MKKIVIVLSSAILLFACNTTKKIVAETVEAPIEEIVKEESKVYPLHSAGFNSKEIFDVIFLDGIDSLGEKAPTIKIDGSKVSGFGGCNRYFGSVNTTEKETFFSPMGSTRMMCPGLMSRVETKFFEHLRNADRGTLINNVMTFYKGDKVIIKARYVKKIIIDGDWQIIYMTGVSGGFGESTLTLNFDGKKVSGSTGCNTFSGIVNRKEYAISFSDISQTEMDCGENKMDIEKLFNDHFSKVTKFTMREDLVMSFYVGNKMVFRALRSK